MDWDWLAVAGTAALGFAAAQAGAWLQHRRDTRTQRARDVAENERFTRQLEAHSREAAAQRATADILDWRDRRVVAYQNVLITADAFVATADDMAKQRYLIIDGEPNPAHVSLQKAIAALKESLFEADLISTEALRTSSNALWSAVEGATTSVENMVDSLQWVEYHRGGGKGSEPGFPGRRSNITTLLGHPPFADKQWNEHLRYWQVSRKELGEATQEWSIKGREALRIPD